MKKEVVEIDYSSLSYDELSQLSRDDHQEDVRQYDKQQNALCLIMIGAITLVCAILFFLLSFARVKNQRAGLDTGQLQFYVCIACLVATIVLFAIGFTRFFKAYAKRKLLKDEINKVSRVKVEKMKEMKGE